MCVYNCCWLAACTWECKYLCSSKLKKPRCLMHLKWMNTTSARISLTEASVCKCMYLLLLPSQLPTPFTLSSGSGHTELLTVVYSWCRWLNRHKASRRNWQITWDIRNANIWHCQSVSLSLPLCHSVSVCVCVLLPLFWWHAIQNSELRHEIDMLKSKTLISVGIGIVAELNPFEIQVQLSAASWPFI